jgi:hypothetical protein
MKKTVKRATLLEDVLNDFLEVEDILLQLELKDAIQPLTEKEKQLYGLMKTSLRELVTDLTHDIAQKHLSQLREELRKIDAQQVRPIQQLTARTAPGRDERYPRSASHRQPRPARAPPANA